MQYLDRAACERIAAHVHSKYGETEPVEAVIRVACRNDISKTGKYTRVGHRYHACMRFALQQFEAECKSAGIPMWRGSF
jgi:hypothetical protein